MLIDHIFIFMNHPSQADCLVDFGLIEGSGRKHQGIGTANRRFFFENFYLELIWVADESEAQSNHDLDLHQRWQYQTSNYSRFGVCLQNTDQTDPIFQSARAWQAPFLPQDQHVDLISKPQYPWLFRFPKNRPAQAPEPRKHANQIKFLTSVELKLSELAGAPELSMIETVCPIRFYKAPSEHLTLEFDQNQQHQSKIFPELSLEIRF